MQKRQPPETIFEPEEAIAIFEYFERQTNYAWNYFKTGCHQRAYQMGYDLRDNDIEVRQLRMATLKSKFVPVAHPVTGKTLAKWRLHRAIGLTVKIPQTDQTEQVIIDPALFDGPIKYDQWCKILGLSEKDITSEELPGINVQTIRDRVSQNLKEYAFRSRIKGRTDRRKSQWVRDYYSRDTPKPSVPEIIL